MKEYQIYKEIICIDLKSFYASVECSFLNLDPFKTPLVVADKSRGGGSVVLAVTPFLKNLGVPSRCRIYELPKNINIIFRRPQMKKYMIVAKKIIEIYLNYISEEDLHIYSIDEAFLDLTPYLSLYKKNTKEIAQDILRSIYKKTGIYASCGIGKNMLLSKLALDLEAKDSPDFISCWDYNSVKEKLWKVNSLSKMWGIGPRLEKKLHRLGITNVYDLAHYNKEALKEHFGILGEELYYHANGIDQSKIQDKKYIFSKRKSYGQSQVLFRDYYAPDIYIIIRETVDELTRKLRSSNYYTQTIRLGISYSKDFSSGFNRQITLDEPTMSGNEIFKACIKLFQKFYKGFPIRKIYVGLTKLKKLEYKKISIFDYEEKSIEAENNIFHKVDEIKRKFGKNFINRSSSMLDSSTIRSRNKMVGGHHE
jgi:DNA polymerase V